MLNEIPEDIKLFSKIYAELTLKINKKLNQEKITKKALAERLKKKPSEISKWLTGNHNLTLKSLCKLQVELGIELIQIPKDEIFETVYVDFENSCNINLALPPTKQAKIIPLHNVEFSNEVKLVANY